jgi:hypothetical protein
MANRWRRIDQAKPFSHYGPEVFVEAKDKIFQSVIKPGECSREA